MKPSDPKLLWSRSQWLSGWNGQSQPGACWIGPGCLDGRQRLNALKNIRIRSWRSEVLTGVGVKILKWTLSEHWHCCCCALPSPPLPFALCACTAQALMPTAAVWSTTQNFLQQLLTSACLSQLRVHVGSDRAFLEDSLQNWQELGKSLASAWQVPWWRWPCLRKCYLQEDVCYTAFSGLPQNPKLQQLHCCEDSFPRSPWRVNVWHNGGFRRCVWFGWQWRKWRRQTTSSICSDLRCFWPGWWWTHHFGGGTFGDSPELMVSHALCPRIIFLRRQVVKTIQA